jgi:hypothetical protein
VYGFMLLVFIILAIVTACVTVVGTYFLLNAENYHWQWTSFTMSASTSAYVFLYAVRAGGGGSGGGFGWRGRGGGGGRGRGVAGSGALRGNGAFLGRGLGSGGLPRDLGRALHRLPGRRGDEALVGRRSTHMSLQWRAYARETHAQALLNIVMYAHMHAHTPWPVYTQTHKHTQTCTCNNTDFPPSPLRVLPARPCRQVHYYLFKTRMSGFFQTAFYFGYTAMFCFGLALMCGAIGYWAAAAFVRTIYRWVPGGAGCQGQAWAGAMRAGGRWACARSGYVTWGGQPVLQVGILPASHNLDMLAACSAPLDTAPPPTSLGLFSHLRTRARRQVKCD